MNIQMVRHFKTCVLISHIHVKHWWVFCKFQFPTLQMFKLFINMGFVKTLKTRVGVKLMISKVIRTNFNAIDNILIPSYLNTSFN